MGESIISLRAGKSSLSDLIIGGHIGEIVATEDIDVNSFVGAELSTNGFPKSYYSLSSVYNLPSSYTTKGNSYQLSPNKSILFGEDSSCYVHVHIATHILDDLGAVISTSYGPELLNFKAQRDRRKVVGISDTKFLMFGYSTSVSSFTCPIWLISFDSEYTTASVSEPATFYADLNPSYMTSCVLSDSKAVIMMAGRYSSTFYLSAALLTISDGNIAVDSYKNWSYGSTFYDINIGRATDTSFWFSCSGISATYLIDINNFSNIGNVFTSSNPFQKSSTNAKGYMFEYKGNMYSIETVSNSNNGINLNFYTLDAESVSVTSKTYSISKSGNPYICLDTSEFLLISKSYTTGVSYTVLTRISIDELINNKLSPLYTSEISSSSVSLAAGRLYNNVPLVMYANGFYYISGNYYVYSFSKKLVCKPINDSSDTDSVLYGISTESIASGVSGKIVTPYYDTPS